MAACKCGCGEPVKRGKMFVKKEHQLEWMINGGAREMNKLQPLEAKARGRQISGQAAASSGRLEDASRKGALKSREIAEEFRKKRGL